MHESRKGQRRTSLRDSIFFSFAAFLHFIVFAFMSFWGLCPSFAFSVLALLFSLIRAFKRSAEIFDICVSSGEFKTISVSRRNNVRSVVWVDLFTDLAKILIRIDSI